MSDRILVVEDEASIRTIVEYALRDAGFQVIGAGRGDEALDVVEREPVDLVVLDIMLPGMDGLEVCKRIRAGRNIPIIMLSARGEELDKVLGTALKTLIFDLAGLEYTTSAGLRSFLRAQKAMKQRGGDTLFVNVQPPVKKVFEIAKAANLNTVFRSVRELDAYLDAMQKKAKEEAP